MESRAVERVLLATDPVSLCAHEGCSVHHRAVQWMPRKTLREVVCNVYQDGRWRRVDHYHPECYDAAGSPYGDAVLKRVRRRRAD